MLKKLTKWQPRSRLWAFFSLSIYLASFELGYYFFLSTVWEYWGFSLNEHSLKLYSIAYLIAVFPALWLPMALAKISSYFQWLMQIFIYMPSILVSLHVREHIEENTSFLWLAMLTGMFVIRLCCLSKLQIALIRVRRVIVIRSVAFITAVFSVLIWFFFKDVIGFVSFEDIYIQRFLIADVSHGFVVYALWWLIAVFFPFLMSWGVWKRNITLFFIAFVGEIALYGIGALKATIVTAVIVPGLYYFVHRYEKLFGLVFPLFVAFLALAATVLSQVETPIGNIIAGTLLARCLGIPGLSTVQYQDFFSASGYTWWSHVSLFRTFLEYPYDRELPYLIGAHFYDNPQLSANAHFWATDGIAAAGLAGIVLISLFCGTTLMIFDSASRGLPIAFVVAWSGGVGLSFLNVGFFTLILTFGLGIIITMSLLVPRETAALILELRSAEAATNYQ
jgi:hypothetical protein